METEIILAFIDPVTAGLIVGNSLYNSYKGSKAKKKAKRRAKALKGQYNQASAEANKIASEDLISKGDVNVATNIATRDSRVNMQNYLDKVRGQMIAGGLGNSSIGAIVGADQTAKMESDIADKKMLALINAGTQNKQYKDKYRMMAQDYKIKGKEGAIAHRTASENYADTISMSSRNDIMKLLLQDSLSTNRS